jgi:hypothetical protein
MRTSDDKSIFIKTLKETPFISYAAQKSGVPRSTIYRWIKSHLGFKERVENAINEGRKRLNDVAEMALIKKIKDGDMRAIIFYLERTDKRYFPKRTSYEEPIRELKSGEQCPTCGHEKIDLNLKGEEMKEVIRDMAEELGLLPGPLSGFVAEGIEKEEKEEREKLLREHEEKKGRKNSTL